MEPGADFSPLKLMTAVESGKARRLLGKLERHHEWVRLDAELPSAERLGYDHFRPARKELDEALNALAANVLSRELGLERYMVIHTIRSDGHETRLQLLSMGFQQDRWAGRSRWMWAFHGRRLRKDGTIGDLGDWACLEAGSITRRRLDGTWEKLI